MMMMGEDEQHSFRKVVLFTFCVCVCVCVCLITAFRSSSKRTPSQISLFISLSAQKCLLVSDDDGRDKMKFFFVGKNFFL